MYHSLFGKLLFSIYASLLLGILLRYIQLEILLSVRLSFSARFICHPSFIDISSSCANLRKLDFMLFEISRVFRINLHRRQKQYPFFKSKEVPVIPDRCSCKHLCVGFDQAVTCVFPKRSDRDCVAAMLAYALLKLNTFEIYCTQICIIQLLSLKVLPLNQEITI